MANVHARRMRDILAVCIPAPNPDDHNQAEEDRLDRYWSRGYALELQILGRKRQTVRLGV